MHSFFMGFRFQIVTTIFQLSFIMGIYGNVVERIINISEDLYFLGSMLPAHLI